MMATPIIFRVLSFGGLSVDCYFKRNAMENQSYENDQGPAPVQPVAPTLNYRAASEERKGPGAIDAIAASIAIIVAATGAFLVIGSATGTFEFAVRNDDRVWVSGLILLLLLAGMLSAIRSAWFYLGGWSRASDSRSENRKILFPWRWR
jgi:hypothetical protein